MQARHIEALGTGGLASKGSRGGTASVSAHAAQQAHHRVQRLVTLLQIHQVSPPRPLLHLLVLKVIHSPLRFQILLYAPWNVSVHKLSRMVLLPLHEARPHMPDPQHAAGALSDSFLSLTCKHASFKVLWGTEGCQHWHSAPKEFVITNTPEV